MMTVKVDGLAALGQQLEALGRDMSTKVLRQAGRAALAPVQDDMHQHAGFNVASATPICATVSKYAAPHAGGHRSPYGLALARRIV